MQINMKNPMDTSTTAMQEATQGMGKQEFMKLFLAQLSQQDPLNPLDDKAFIAQLAQFTSLEQAIESNQKLAALELAQGAVVNGQSTALIGKEITARGDLLSIANGQPPPIHFGLTEDAAQVTASVIDSRGMVVRTVTMGPQRKGAVMVPWDGLSDSGKRLADGDYSLSMNAYDADGNGLEVDPRVAGKVTGVSFDAGYAELLIGSSRIRLGDVIEIQNTAMASVIP